MVKYIIATIVSAIVFGILAAFFPNAFITDKFTLLTALAWVIVIMTWSFVVYMLNRREKNKDTKEINKRKKG